MIFYVEDEASIRDLSLYALKQAGLEAKGFPEAESFREAVRRELPDLILLDIMIPGTDGLTLLRELRESPRTRHIPVMMLTAKGTELDKVIGLDTGADDYLAKPFGMMELVSRCKALLRRCLNAPQGAQGSPTRVCGPIKVDPEAREAWVGEVPLDLTLKEFDLLGELLANQGRVLTRSQLLESVWEISFVGETRTVDAHIQTLRHKLNDAKPGSGDYVQTVRGVGYCIKDMRSHG